MDVEVAIAVFVAFLARIDPVEPVIGNNFPGRVVDQSGIGIRCVGVGVDPPVSLVDILLDGLCTVNIGGVVV